VRQADTALLATVLYVIALGLYSLFVDDTIPMPLWLRIRTLGDLKELLASVVIVVIAVVFLGFALTWDGSRDLLILGLSCAAVSAALAAFSALLPPAVSRAVPGRGSARPGRPP